MACRDLMMNKYKLHKSTNATIEGVDVDVELQMYNIYKLATATAPPPPCKLATATAPQQVTSLSLPKFTTTLRLIP